MVAAPESPAVRPLPREMTWTADELLARSSRWQIWWPEDLAEDLEQHGTRSPKLARLAARVRQGIQRQNGVVLLRGLEDSGIPRHAWKDTYLAIGAAMGRVMTEYGELYEVCDRGGDYRTTQIPVSQTSAGTGFHTDSSRLDCIPDAVSLLCEQPAETGGDSLLSNALAVRAALEGTGALEILEQAWIRDLVTPGVEKTPEALRANRFPVFGTDERGQPLFRYMRYWIERGQERAGQPLTARELEALDQLDAALAHPAHALRFRLQPGEMLWMNNRILAHNRTDYVQCPERPRSLWRMWIDFGAAQAG